ncbi:hypothetical protein SDC9_133654 [bioreactor metagenome]|uniref:Uncharacterized protein n=1 Tax=bioreactor metagenome TaxID=1076179 RepID=A0A645DBK2_9ZZZZ
MINFFHHREDILSVKFILPLIVAGGWTAVHQVNFHTVVELDAVLKHIHEGSARLHNFAVDVINDRLFGFISIKLMQLRHLIGLGVIEKPKENPRIHRVFRAPVRLGIADYVIVTVTQLLQNESLVVFFLLKLVCSNRHSCKSPYRATRFLPVTYS